MSEPWVLDPGQSLLHASDSEASPPHDGICENIQGPFVATRKEAMQDISETYNSFAECVAGWSKAKALAVTSDKPFLVQLNEHCTQSGVRVCNRNSCRRRREELDRVVPSCGWIPFRDWALVTLSCYDGFLERSHRDEWYANRRACLQLRDALTFCIHLLNHFRLDKQKLMSMSDLSEGVELVERRDTSIPSQRIAGEQHNSRSYGRARENGVSLFEVFELLHWMWEAELREEMQPFQDFDSEVSSPNYLPEEVFASATSAALEESRRLGLCQKRLWNLLNASPRKVLDIFGLVDMARRGSLTHGDGHTKCNAELCFIDNYDSTLVQQLHKCRNKNCKQTLFNLRDLESQIRQDLPTAWIIMDSTRTSSLVGKEHKGWMAVSHVWSDGTGIGLGTPGEVNLCLFEYFCQVAIKLECDGIWWDAICIPTEREMRAKSLNTMHENYERAKCTIVHDEVLAQREWTDDGSPCIALVLSSWFTRGWTALELWASGTVKVIFKDAQNPDGYVLKDLDADILVKNKLDASAGHRVASSIIEQHRQKGQHMMRQPRISDLMTMLYPRTTSWSRDRMIIAGLMGNFHNFDSKDSDHRTTEKIINLCSSFSSSYLLHGELPTHLSGSWSWCAPSLFQMHRPDADGYEPTYVLMNDDDPNAPEGEAVGPWNCRLLTEDDSLKLVPYSSHGSVILRVEEALNRWQACLLLSTLIRRPGFQNNRPQLQLLVLVAALSYEEDQRYADKVLEGKGQADEKIRQSALYLDCQYVGSVVDRLYQEPDTRSRKLRVRLGRDGKAAQYPARRYLDAYMEMMAKDFMY